MLGVLVLPDGAAPPLALVEPPDGGAPPLALAEVEVEVEVDVDWPVDAVPLAVVEVAVVEAGAVELLGRLVALLECEEPPHPAMTRKAARSAGDAARRLTFPA